jgi:Family of unknown function (DUF5947)
MTTTGDTRGGSRNGSRLQRLAQRSSEARVEAQERCELCSEPIPPDHRHLLDLSTRELMCACRACTILFNRDAAGGGHYRLVPDRRLRIEDFQLGDPDWEGLHIPVDMAFFFHSTQAARVVAFYPSPMGATESLLPLDTWRAIEDANPVLRQMEPDVEALLVNRARGARDYRLVPIDECYALVGLIRSRWRGLTGGKEVWEEIGSFLETLDRRSRSIHSDGSRDHAPASAKTAGEDR